MIMNIHTFGNKNNKAIVMIHGMLTPWHMWQEAIEYFEKDHYVVVPELDAHTLKEVSHFNSVEDEADKISMYIKENLEGKVYMLCGLSMGGRIAATIAKDKALMIERLVLDGAPLKKMPGILVSIMKKNYKSIIKKSKARDKKIMESCKRDFLPEERLEDFLVVADKIETASIDNILESISGDFEYIKYNSNMKILFMHGTKGNEAISMKSAAMMKQVNPQTVIKCYKGYAHGHLAGFEQSKWIKEVEEWINEW